MYVNYSTSSGQQTATGQVSPNRGSLMGADLTPPSAGFVTLTIYDSENSSIAGKLILTELICDAGSVGLNHEFYAPVAVNRGIYCTLTYTGGGTAAKFYVRYASG